MLGNCELRIPTAIYFGPDAIDGLRKELKNVGKNVVLIYGGGSVKRNGIYDDVVQALKEADKSIAEISGVMPNPTIEKLSEGIEIARNHHADFLLAVGGGSVCDYTKALSASINCKHDPWKYYYVDYEPVDCEVVPLGCVLTMAGTGSEMNSSSVITNTDEKLKLCRTYETYGSLPRFAILNPKYTLTLPKYQMVAGIYDIFNHICEQYFSGEDDNTSDYMAEGLMRSVIEASRKAIVNQTDYEARSNIMWCATWALNGLIGACKDQDWNVHSIGQAVGAYTDATHGMTLAAVSMAYYYRILEAGRPKFERWAKAVWDKSTAEEGLEAMRSWMNELGLVMNLRELGVTEDMIEGIADATVMGDCGYVPLSREMVIDIIKASL